MQLYKKQIKKKIILTREVFLRKIENDNQLHHLLIYFQADERATYLRPRQRENAHIRNFRHQNKSPEPRKFDSIGNRNQFSKLSKPDFKTNYPHKKTPPAIPKRCHNSTLPAIKSPQKIEFKPQTSRLVRKLSFDRTVNSWQRNPDENFGRDKVNYFKKFRCRYHLSLF